jgi:hypothetical protein
MVGLRNEGTGPHLNALLQSLLYVLPLRKAVYDMTTAGEGSVTGVALALQRTFYRQVVTFCYSYEFSTVMHTVLC